MGLIKNFALLCGSILALVISYQIFMVASTWDKDNTDELVKGLWIVLIFAAMLVVVTFAIIASIRTAIKSRMQPAYDDDYAPMPTGRGRGQQPQAYPYDYNVPAGQPQQRALPGPVAGMQGQWGQQQPQQGQYGTPYGGQPQYGQANGYGFAPVMPPPAGQMQNQGAQYDLNGSFNW